MIFHLGTQWLTFMAILQGSESVMPIFPTVINLPKYTTMVINNHGNFRRRQLRLERIRVNIFF